MNLQTREQKRALLAKFKTATDFPLKASGIVAEVVPPPMAAWIIAGEVPESLFGAAVSAVQSGPTATAEALKMPEMFGLAIKIVYGSFRWPALTPQNEPEAPVADDDADRLNPYTLPIPDLSEVLAWGISGTKDAMVQTDSGEVKGAELMSFRQNGSVPGYSEDGGQVQAESSTGLSGSPAV